MTPTRTSSCSPLPASIASARTCASTVCSQACRSLEWNGELDQMAFQGWRRLHEIEFFHPKTRTLITGDLCCNFGLMTRLVAQGHVCQRLGPPTECRMLGIFRDRRAVRRSLVRILEWDFERILTGHGEIVHTGGRDTFEKDFARLLR